MGITHRPHGASYVQRKRSNRNRHPSPLCFTSSLLFVLPFPSPFCSCMRSFSFHYSPSFTARILLKAISLDSNVNEQGMHLDARHLPHTRTTVLYCFNVGVPNTYMRSIVLMCFHSRCIVSYTLNLRSRLFSSSNTF